MYIHKKKKTNEEDKWCCNIFMYTIFLHWVLISTLEGRLLGVFFIGDICEIFIGVFIPLVVLVMYTEC